LRLIIKRFDVDNPGVTLVKLPKGRRKSAINPPTQELVEAAVKQAVRRNSLKSAKDSEPDEGNSPVTKLVNLRGKSKELFGETDSAEEELLKEISTPTQASTPLEEQIAAATNELLGPIPRKSRRLSSDSESEPELRLTEEDEQEVLKNAALSSIRHDKAVDTLEEAAKKLDLASGPMTN
jgi:hypothetical protein